jgi:hypothetical protein
MIVSMIIYDLNYSRIGERRIHTVDWGMGGRDRKGVFSLHVTGAYCIQNNNSK